MLTRADTVHHKTPLSEDESLALVLDNLQSLCAGCHNAVHNDKGGSQPKYAKRKARIIQG